MQKSLICLILLDSGFRVPNLPCGVESRNEVREYRKELKFLIYRVELKAETEQFIFIALLKHRS